MSVIIIYHANCCDGFAAAWVARQYFEGKLHITDIEYIACNYQEDWDKKYDLSEKVKNNEVYVFDFSFPREYMIKLHGLAAIFEVHDHHKTAKEACESLDFCHFDVSRSGAMLAWNRLFPDASPPKFIEYVQDYDLWQFKLAYSKEINAVIHSYEKEFERYDIFDYTIENQFVDIVKEGSTILRLENNHVQGTIKHAQSAKIGDHIVPMINNPNLISKTLEQLSKGQLFAAAFFLKDNQWVVSLRSRNDESQALDVGVIAKIYGGGGHKHAAGFKYTGDIRDLLAAKENQ